MSKECLSKRLLLCRIEDFVAWLPLDYLTGLWLIFSVEVQGMPGEHWIMMVFSSLYIVLFSSNLKHPKLDAIKEGLSSLKESEKSAAGKVIV